MGFCSRSYAPRLSNSITISYSICNLRRLNNPGRPEPRKIRIYRSSYFAVMRWTMNYSSSRIADGKYILNHIFIVPRSKGYPIRSLDRRKALWSRPHSSHNTLCLVSRFCLSNSFRELVQVRILLHISSHWLRGNCLHAHHIQGSSRIWWLWR